MPKLKKEEIISIIFLLLTALLWGSGFSVRKIALENITPLFFNSLRFFIGFVLVFIFYLALNKGKINPEHPERAETPCDSIKTQVFGGSMMGLMLALGSALQQIALMTTPVGNVAFLTTLYTIMVPIISAVFLKHKVQMKIWICAIIAIMGIYLVGGGFDFSLKIGDVLAILCALTFAVQVLLTGKFAKKSDVIFLSIVQMLVASLGNLALSLIFESGNSISGILAAIFPLMYSAVFALALPYTFQIIGQKHSKPAIAAIILSMESVFGALFGAIILKEMMSLVQISGCVLIFSAIVLTQVNIKKIGKH